MSARSHERPSDLKMQTLSRVPFHGRHSGVLVVPDFIANAGCVICAAMEYRGGTQHAAFDHIDERVGANTGAVLEESRRDKTLPRAAALALAERRVRSAVQLRGWH